MSEQVKVLSVIVCDDIRQEISGKVTLVGCYSGSLVLNGFPLVVPLGVFIVVEPLKTKYDKVSLSVKAPDGTELKLGDLAGVFTDLRYPGSLSFKFPSVSLTVEGVYEFYLCMDSEPQTVLRLPVVKRENTITRTN
jgi:hypothetical protein